MTEYEAIEYIVTESPVLEKLAKSNRKTRRVLTAEIEKEAEKAYFKIKAQNKGLSEDAIIDGWDADQKEQAAAMQEYLFARYPATANKLFRNGFDLWNMVVLCTLCAFDQGFDIMAENKLKK